MERADFRAWVTERIRYGDTDRQGHVNNATYATYFETGRVETFNDPANPLRPEGCSFVIARLTIEYKAELFWPGSVDVGLKVLKLGASSLTVAQGIFQGDRLIAAGEAVMVLFDDRVRKPTPLPETLRQSLQALL